MEDPGDKLRSKVLQPVADAVYARFRVNCFALASAILALSAVGDVACIAHALPRAVTDLADTFIQDGFLSTSVACAFHLRSFARRDHGSAFRVVYPVMRPAYVFFFNMAWIYPILAAPKYLAYAVGAKAGMEFGWSVAGDASFGLFVLGSMVAGCEWRRLPPVRRREPAAAGRWAPSPA